MQYVTGLIINSVRNQCSRNIKEERKQQERSNKIKLGGCCCWIPNRAYLFKAIRHIRNQFLQLCVFENTLLSWAHLSICLSGRSWYFFWMDPMTDLQEVAWMQ